MKYIVKKEFIDRWTNEDLDQVIVDDKEISRLSREWDVSIEDLMKQVEVYNTDPAIFVISGDMDVVEGPFDSTLSANRRRDYLNSYLTTAELSDHAYITIRCNIDEDGNADLTAYDVLEEV